MNDKNNAIKKATGKTKTYYADSDHDNDMGAIKEMLSTMPHGFAKKYENESAIINIGRKLVRKEIERKAKKSQ